MEQQEQPGLLPWLKFNNASWKIVSEQGNLEIYHAGHVLNAGKHGELLYICKGEVCQWVEDDAKNEKLLMILRAGSLLGEECLFSKLHLNLKTVVTEETATRKFTSQEVLKLIQQNPDLFKEMIHSMLKKMDLILQQIEELSFDTIAQRLARFLCLVNQLERTPYAVKELNKTFSPSYLAKVIGANRVIVSRIMADFKNKGLIIESKGGFQVTEPEKLLTYAKEP